MSRVARTAASARASAAPALVGCSSGDRTASSAEAAPERVGQLGTSRPPPDPRGRQLPRALASSEATDPVDAGSTGPVPPAAHVGHDQGGRARRPRRRPPARGRLAHRARPDREGLPRRPGAYVGGDQTTQRLSRLRGGVVQPVARAGRRGRRTGSAATSWRCAPRASCCRCPRRMKGVLDAAGRARPVRHLRHRRAGRGAASQRVVCSAEALLARRRRRRPARSDARYLAKDAAATGDASCKDVAAERADGALKYTWSFEWPTRAQWAAGQRYGYCWVPEG